MACAPRESGWLAIFIASSGMDTRFSEGWKHHSIEQLGSCLHEISCPSTGNPETQGPAWYAQHFTGRSIHLISMRSLGLDGGRTVCRMRGRCLDRPPARKAGAACHTLLGGATAPFNLWRGKVLRQVRQQSCHWPEPPSRGRCGLDGPAGLSAHALSPDSGVYSVTCRAA
jgi:hypothetical protein